MHEHGPFFKSLRLTGIVKKNDNEGLAGSQQSTDHSWQIENTCVNRSNVF